MAQQNATWLNYGKVAEQALPVFRNVVEAVTYAMFPLFVLLLLLTSGRETMLAFKGYAAVLIWIQLWPPLYAILNYMASIYGAYDLAAAADLGTGTKALALQTASTIYSRAISGEAVVGYLAISIPFIALSLLHIFLDRNLRLGMAALDKNYTLQQTQRDQANQIRQRAQAMLMQLSQEKNLLYQKVGSFRAVASHLEQLERQLRSSMPQHVMDMLGQQAAYLAQ